jgi:hypothetical protein
VDLSPSASLLLLKEVTNVSGNMTKAQDVYPNSLPGGVHPSAARTYWWADLSVTLFIIVLQKFITGKGLIQEILMHLPKGILES